MVRNATVTDERIKDWQALKGPLLLYAAPSVASALASYFSAFDEAAAQLSQDSPALHPSFKKLAHAHNDLILEMRRDALALSAFAYRGKSRLD